MGSGESPNERGTNESGDPDTEDIAIYQPRGGLLDPERCLVAHVDLAHENGGTIRARERVTSWQSLEDGVRVRTSHDDYYADRLVITAGTWTPGLVDDLEGLVVPERTVTAWFHPVEPKLFTPDRFPAVTLEANDGWYYGYPRSSIPGFEFGRYHHREEVVDPDQFARDPMPTDEQLLRSAGERHFPSGTGTTMGLRTGLSTTTSDGVPILDTLPDDPDVTVAVGFSGRQFALAPAVGELVARRVLEDTGESTREYDLEGFSLDRL